MSNNVTDRIILKKIYDLYYSEFRAYDQDKPSRSGKIYVPIDCDLVAKELKVDPDLVFGRLYYHLEKKHGYKQDDGAFVHLFALRIGGDHHAVNFPLLSAVLAEHEQSYRRFTLPLLVSLMALLISITAYITSNF